MAGVAQADSSNQTALILQKLEARHTALRVEREQRQQQLQETADPRENTDNFLEDTTQSLRRLQEQCSSLQQQVMTAGQTEATKQQALQQVEDASSDLAALEQFTASAAYFLPPFELRSTTAQLQSLRSQLAGVKQQLQPRRKFAFSKAVTRTAAAPTSTQQQKQTRQDSEPLDQQQGFSVANGLVLAHNQQPASSPAQHKAVGSTNQPALNAAAVAAAVAAEGVVLGPSVHDLQLIQSGQGLMGLRGGVVVKTADQLAGQAFVLHDLQDCTVYLLGTLSALRLQHLRNCHVFAGPVKGATLVSNVGNCTCMLAAHQVRIHDAQACDFYLRVRSRPIMEHSNGLRFAPLDADALAATLQQPRQQQQQWLGLLGLAQLSEHNLLWQQVDDFGWVKASQSPHWSLLPEQQQQQ